MLPMVLESFVPLTPGPSRTDNRLGLGTAIGLSLTNIVRVISEALAIVCSPEGNTGLVGGDGDMMTWQQK
jgi:hypothetical protein